MGKTTRLEGAEQLNRNLRQFGVNAQKEIQSAVDATTQQVRSTAIRLIQAQSNGATYDSILRTINGQVVPVGSRAGNNLSATHTASAPGDAPNTDTGGLVSSIRANVGRMEGVVFSDVQYAPYLEFGTQNMAERPFLWPAARQHEDDFTNRLDNIADQAARGLTQ